MMDQDSQLALLETTRHSFAHVLAQAILRLYPNAKLGIGPAVEDGFYYDIDIDKELKSEDLPQIEAEMKKIIEEGLVFKQIIIPREQAFDTLHHLGQIYKTELLQQVPDEEISFYKTGEEFIDLCRGPHVNHTGQLEAFKLISINKTNWLGDANRPKMMRVKGVAFLNRTELEQYLEKQEEMILRDHKKLGKELELFLEDDKIGNDLPVFLPKGLKLKQNLAAFLQTELEKVGFQFVESSELTRSHLFTSNIYFDYTKQDFLPIYNTENSSYLLRPNPTVQIFQIYNSSRRSYKELPLKFAEFATSYRKSKGQGLVNSRRYTFDHAFTFINKEAIVPEVSASITKAIELIKELGFENYRLQLVIPYTDKTQFYLGQDQDWKESIWYLEKALQDLGLTFRTIEGNAKFFGPELEIFVKDTFKREWKVSSLSIDLNLPKIMNLRYATNKNEEEIPVVIHQTFFNSLEHMIALLIEEYGGAFPTWLAPVQVSVIPISEKFNTEGKSLHKFLTNQGIKVELDDRDETMQTKIRDAQLSRVPYMIILGEKEINTNSVSVRPRSGQDLGLMRVEEFLEKIQKEIATKEWVLVKENN